MWMRIFLGSAGGQMANGSTTDCTRNATSRLKSGSGNTLLMNLRRTCLGAGRARRQYERTKAIMSKQSAAKEHQGYTRCTPQCGRCIHFKSDKVVATFGVGAFQEERNLRCKIGNFKVNKTAWCRMFELAAKTVKGKESL
jgi:hypothetical protein